MPQPSPSVNHRQKTMLIRLMTMAMYIGKREFCIPMYHPWKANSEMVAGAAQMRAKKDSAA